MIAAFGEPKYLLKCEATFVQEGEHWFAILDAQCATLCQVVMTADQARMTLNRQNLAVISAADYLSRINERKAS